MAQADVIVINWNGRHLLGPCLASLEASTYRDFTVTVYDNGSTDGSVPFIRERFPTVRVIAGDRNVGFAPAVNAAIRATNSPHVLLLNNDAEADPGWIGALIEAAEADPGLGSVASRIVFHSQPDRLNSTGIEIDRCGIAWDRLGGRPASEGDAPADVFGASGGAALYRRAMLDRIGLFDADYFAYLEDVDLAWRAALAGWRCRYAPAARVRHHYSATGGEGSPLKYYLLSRNKVWTVFKNYPNPHLTRFLPAILFYDAITVLYRGGVKRDAQTARGRWAGFTGLPAVLAKRRRVQALATPAGRRRTWASMRPIETPRAVQQRYRYLADLRHDVTAGRFEPAAESSKSL